MKKLFKTSLILALTVFASFAYASGVETYINVRENKTFSVHHNTTGFIHLTIKDEFGKVLHTEKNKQNKEFVRLFSVTQLLAGTYFLEVEDDTKISIYTMEVLSDSLVIDKEHVEKIFKPSVKQNNKSVDVSMLKLSNQPLDLTIVNSKNELVYQASIAENIVNKRFDFSNTQSGIYSMMFKVGDKSFERTINLK